jgi:hypothetical protein
MAAPLLVANQTTGTPQVLVMTGATASTQVGDDIVASLETAHVNDLRTNRVINAFGSVYAGHEDGIYRLQDGSRAGEWSKTSIDGGLTFAAPNGTSSRIYGPFYTVISDEPYAWGVYRTSTSQMWRIWKINLLKDFSDPSRNSESANLNVMDATSSTYITNSMLFNGILYTFPDWTSASPTISAWNPVTETVTNTSWAGINAQEVSFDIWNNQAYAVVRRNNPTLSVVIRKLEAGVWSGSTITLKSGASSGPDDARSQLLFNDGTSMYAIWYDTDVPGFKMNQIDLIGGVETLGADLTSLLPSTIQNSSTALDQRWAVYKDQQADGSTDILLYYAPDRTSTWTQFLWQGNTLPLLQEDSGASSELAIPSFSQGGGDRTFEFGQPTITVYKRTRTTAGQRVTFRVFPPQLGTIEGLDLDNLTVRFFYGTEQEVPDTQALLTGTVTGGTALRNGNDVVGVSADGTTDYTAIIQAFGFGDNDKIELVAQVSDS